MPEFCAQCGYTFLWFDVKYENLDGEGRICRVCWNDNKKQGKPVGAESTRKISSPPMTEDQLVQAQERFSKQNNQWFAVGYVICLLALFMSYLTGMYSSMYTQLLLLIVVGGGFYILYKAIMKIIN